MNRLITGVVTALCIIFFSLNSFAGNPAEPFAGEINADGINIRSDSTVSAATLCKMNTGDRVEVVREIYDWYKIKLPAQTPSFVKKSFVSIREQPSGEITADNVNVRLSPSEKSFIIGRADKGEAVTVLGESNGWYKIKPVKNSFGWVYTRFVKKLPAGTLPQTPTPAPVSLPEKESPTTEILPKAAEQNQAPMHKQVEIPMSVVIPEIPKVAEIKEGILTLVGIVKSYGNVINRIAAHKLITKEKQEYLLQYDRTALNNLTLHTVRVTGTLVTPQRQRIPAIAVEKIEALD